MSRCCHGKVKGQLSLILSFIVMFKVFTYEHTGFNVCGTFKNRKKKKKSFIWVYMKYPNFISFSRKYLLICNRDESFPLIVRFLLFFSFFSKKFGNIMCQNWSEKLKTQQIHVLFMGFPLFFISENFHFCCNENYQNDVHNITSSVWHGFVLTSEPTVCPITMSIRILICINLDRFLASC